MFVSEEHCVIFSKHSVRPWDLPSTSINFSCVCASQFSVNIPCGCGTFCQLTLHPRDVPSTYVNFPCISEIFHQISVWPRAFRKLPSIFCVPAVLPSGSVYSMLIRGTMRPLFVPPRDLSSNVRTSAGLSMNFHQLFVHQWDIQSTFCSTMVPSVNFGQLSVCPQDFLSTFPVAGGPSVNFSCVHRTLHQLP